MKSQRGILVFETLLCISVSVAMVLIARFIYVNAYRTGFIVSFLTNWVIVSLFNWKKEISPNGPKFRWFTFLLIAIAVIIFAIYKPNITYEKGKEIVAAQGYENLYALRDKSITSFKLKHTSLVPDAYLYGGEKHGINYYILLSPIDGEIQTETIGDGNYLDQYFAMKYEPK